VLKIDYCSTLDIEHSSTTLRTTASKFVIMVSDRFSVKFRENIIMLLVVLLIRSKTQFKPISCHFTNSVILYWTAPAGFKIFIHWCILVI